jgi:transposase
MKNFIPTIGIGLRRLINKKLTTITVDEFKTSITCHKCQNILHNFYNKKQKKLIHRLLVCYEGESSQNKINSYVARDFNAAVNIRNIAIDVINGKPRPEAFCRTISTSMSDGNNPSDIE